MVKNGTPNGDGHASIHLARKVIDANGRERTSFTSEEAQWSLKFQAVVLGPSNSPILKPGQAPGATQMIPVPVWEIMHFSADGEHGVAIVVPADGAHIRQPIERVGDKWVPSHVARTMRTGATSNTSTH